jgi:MFS transporter, DHA1 family, tetracycline resistance protein
LNRHNLVILWLVVFIGLMGFGLTTLPFPLVIEQMGGSDFWKTFGGPGVYSLFTFISTPLWGRLSDAVGRKPVLVFSMLGSAIAYVWLGYADSLESVIAARAFGGIMSGNIAAAFAYVTDVTDVRNRARGLGIVSSAFGLGFAIGPFIGGQLGRLPDGSASLLLPCLVAAAASAIAMLGAWFALDESLPAENRKPWRREKKGPSQLPQAATVATASGDPALAPAPAASVSVPASQARPLLSNPVLLGLISAALLISIGGTIMQSVYLFWARDIFGHDIRQVAWQFLWLAGVSTAGQLVFVGPLVARFGERGTAMIAMIGFSVGLLLMTLVPHPVTLWLGITVFGAGLGTFTPSVTSLVSFEADPRSRGAAMGTYQAATSAGRIIGPAVAGPIYFKMSVSAPYLLSAALAVVGLILLLRAPSAHPPGR